MDNRRAIVWSWVVTVLASGYIAFIAFSLSRKVPQFATTFAVLGVETPLATRLVFAVGIPPVLWSLAALLIAALIVKELTVRSLGVRLAISVSAFMLAAFMSAVAVEVMFQPMLQLLRQIG